MTTTILTATLARFTPAAHEANDAVRARLEHMGEVVSETLAEVKPALSSSPTA